MNDHEIEQLLRKAPPVKAPPGLRERLQADIRPSRPGSPSFDRSSWRLIFRRWLPATATVLIAASILGAQIATQSKLRLQKEALEPYVKNIEELRRRNAEYQRLQRENQELERLRKDAAEAQELRAEVTQLESQLKEVEALIASNQQLRMSLPTLNAAGAKNLDALIEEGQGKAKRIQCVNNLKHIGLAAHVWANDEGGHFPTSFLQMTNELPKANFLVCPSDEARQQFSQLDSPQITPAMSSYQFFLNGEKIGQRSEYVIAKCPIHRNYCMSDGSVQQAPDTAVEGYVDGRLTLIMPNRPEARP